MRPIASTEQTLLNWSKVYINDEKQESTFLNNTRIELPDSKLKDGDIITVSQVGSSNTIFRTSGEYIYMDGKILEYTDEVKRTERICKDGRRSAEDRKMPDSPENSRNQNNKEEKERAAVEFRLRKTGKIVKYEEVVRYIEDIPKFTKKHTLLHTREFMRRLGNPCQGRKVLHVAGTNGKGSVCAYMQAILSF